jgi:hypothetical protein
MRTDSSCELITGHLATLCQMRGKLNKEIVKEVVKEKKESTKKPQSKFNINH